LFILFKVNLCVQKTQKISTKKNFKQTKTKKDRIFNILSLKPLSSSKDDAIFMFLIRFSLVNSQVRLTEKTRIIELVRINN
jgi:hypothetical protein